MQSENTGRRKQTRRKADRRGHVGRGKRVGRAMGRPATGRANRPEIVAAAAAEFAARGYAGARVDAIARRAGINKGMLYLRVGNKQALYQAVIIDAISGIRDAVAVALKGKRPGPDQLRTLFAAFTGLVEERPAIPPIMLREVAGGGANLTPPVTRALLEVFSMVQGVLADGVAAGRFRPVDPVKTHILMVGVTMLHLAGAPMRKRMQAYLADRGLLRRSQEQPLAEYLADLLLYGLAEKRGDERRT